MLNYQRVINTKLDLCHEIASSPFLSMLFWDLVSREVAVNHSEMLILDQNKNCKWRFPKMGGTPKSSILIGSLINYPFLGTPICGNPQVFVLSCNVQDRPNRPTWIVSSMSSSKTFLGQACDALRDAMAQWPIWSWQDMESPWFAMENGLQRVGFYMVSPCHIYRS